MSVGLLSLVGLNTTKIFPHLIFVAAFGIALHLSAKCGVGLLCCVVLCGCAKGCSMLVCCAAAAFLILHRARLLAHITHYPALPVDLILNHLRLM